MTIEDQRRAYETVAPAALVVNDDLSLQFYQFGDERIVNDRVQQSRDYLLAAGEEWAADFNQEFARNAIGRMLDNAAAGVSAPYKLMHHDEFLGSMGFNSRNGSTAIMGYWIVESAQGKGYATAAAQALIDFGIHRWGLTEIILEIDTINGRGNKMAERLGAVLDGPNPDDPKEQIWKITEHEY